MSLQIHVFSERPFDNSHVCILSQPHLMGGERCLGQIISSRIFAILLCHPFQQMGCCLNLFRWAIKAVVQANFPTEAIHDSI